MDSDTLRSLLLLVCGGLLTALGAWLRDLTAEKLRRTHKLEEAYLTWLNMHHGVLARLKALSRVAERDPDSTESMRRILQRYDDMEADLLKLNGAVNTAFLLEKKAPKKQLLQSHSEILALLAAHLGEILGHHRSHLSFYTTIGEAQEVVDGCNELLSGLGVGESAEERREEIAANLEAAVRVRDKAKEHLATCSRELHSDAKELTEEIQRVIDNAKVVREAISR
jgi:hypothetical protein